MPFAGAWKPFPALSFALIINLVTAIPELAFPINSQVPPVAYVSQPFSFAFSATTFVSTAPQISYAITRGPAWLNLDSSHRRFSGTPNRSDVGSTIIQLLASDETGDSSTNVTFVVLESAYVSSDFQVFPQLQLAGPASTPNSLLLHPLQSFRLRFSNTTFSGTSSSTRYYAVSADNTPLPPWIQFEATKLRFSGTSPPLVSPLELPQTYHMRLIASNVPGYAEVTIEFNIIVGQHVLAFSSFPQSANISKGEAFRTPPLRSSLQIDGEMIADNQIQGIVKHGPDWITLDETDLSLSGIPNESINTSVTLIVTDVYNDVASATILLQASELLSLSIGTVADVNVTIGEYFSVTLSTPAFNPSIRATPDLGSAASWLHFEARTWVLSGQPPDNLSPTTLHVPITFQNGTTHTSGVITLRLLDHSARTSGTPAYTQEPTTASQASKNATSTDSGMSTHQVSSSTRRVLLITMVTFLSVVSVLLAILVLLFLLKRRRKEKRATEGSNEEDSVSAGHDPYQSPGEAGPVGETPQAPISPRSIPPARPPRIDLTWSNDSLQQSRHRLSGIASSSGLRKSNVSTRQLALAGQAVQSGSANLANNSNAQFSEDDTRLPPQPHSEERSPRGSASADQLQQRQSATMNRQTVLFHPVGLPQRQSGVGHGAGILTHSDAVGNRASWRSVLSSNPFRASRRSTVVLESFPIPPSDGSQLLPTGSPEKIPVPSVRIIDGDEGQNLSFEEQRQKWHTERARARLEGSFRFSNSGSSRMMTPLRPLRPGNAKLAPRDHRPSAVTIINENKGIGHHTSREQSWSRWSALGPAQHDSPAVEGRVDSYGGPGLSVRSNASMASSRQFESAASSSDSNWEDENIIMEESEDVGEAERRSPSSARGSLRFI